MDTNTGNRNPVFSNEEKWRRILTAHIRNRGYEIDCQAAKDLAAMLQHYEYDADHIWWKHGEELEKLD